MGALTDAGPMSRFERSPDSVHVFPGGAVDPADRSDAWKPLLGQPAVDAAGYRRAGRSRRPSHANRGRRCRAVSAGPIVARGRPHLADKIAAVRETFEECGILMVQPAEKLATIPAADLLSWRKRVRLSRAPGGIAARPA